MIADRQVTVVTRSLPPWVKNLTHGMVVESALARRRVVKAAWLFRIKKSPSGRRKWAVFFKRTCARYNLIYGNEEVLVDYTNDCLTPRTIVDICMNDAKNNAYVMRFGRLAPADANERDTALAKKGLIFPDAFSHE
jgi:hypothetical protein